MTGFFARRDLLRCIGSAFLYSALTLIFQDLLNMPNIDIRISAFLPPLLGLIWGIPGALGIAIGNFISDMLSLNYINNTLFVCILGSAGNFLVAYLPYKLWYSFSVDESTQVFSINARNFLKYVLIISISTFTTSLYLALAMNDNFISVNHAYSYFILIFVNNIDVSLLFCTPFLILLSSNSYKFSPPKNRLSIPLKFQRYFDILLLITIFFGVLVLSLPSGTSLNILPVRLILIMSIFIYCFKPCSSLPQLHPTTLRVKKPIQFKITSAICLFALCSIIVLVFSNFLEYRMYSHVDPIAAWINLYRDIFFTLHLIFATLIFFIWNTEKQLILPLQQLTKATSEFVSSDHESPLALNLLPKIRTDDEIELLADSFGKMMVDMKHYVSHLKEILAERERVSAELNIAMLIQTSMLPSTAIINERLKDLHLSALMYPAQEVGGDFYDFFFIDDDNLALVIADVSGKGMPAALFMTISRTLLHTKAQSGLTPAEIFQQVNNELCENNSELMFTTAFMAIYNLSSRHLCYANAGHTKPLLCHIDAPPEFLAELSGPMLAVMEDTPYQNYEHTLAAGDLLILYTDGVTEAENTQGEFYANERLITTFSQFNSEDNKQDAATILLQDVSDFVNGAAQSDDITILTLYLK